MSLNFPEDRKISETVSHTGMSTGFPECTVMDISHNARDSIWDGERRPIKIHQINPEEGNISVSDSNVNWEHALFVLIKNPLYFLYKLCLIGTMTFNITLLYSSLRGFIPLNLILPWVFGFMLISFSLVDALRRSKYIETDF